MKVLIVDDSAVSRKLLQRKVASLGYEVLCAGDGIEALNLMSSALPAAVISDLNMPNLDGMELCRAMRRDSRLSRVPVILTCASAVSESDRETAIEAGAATFVTRTSMLQEVLAALNIQLGGA